jgi:hypothetical protein
VKGRLWDGVQCDTVRGSEEIPFLRPGYLGAHQNGEEGDGCDQEWLGLFHGSTPYCLWIMLRRVHHDFIHSNSNAN